jgi:hypothetical protein
MMMRKISIILFLCAPLCAERIKPLLDFAVQDKYLQNLRPIFTSLTSEEKNTPWGIEYQIGIGFAKKLDLYQAMTSFKRADILIGDTQFQRKAEIQYQIINCYYLGKRYQDVVDFFEESILASTDRNFLAFQDLLIILFESYLKCDDVDRAKWMLHTTAKFYPTLAKKLEITQAICQADLLGMKQLANVKETEEELAKMKWEKEDFSIRLVSDEGEEEASFDKEKMYQLEEYAACQKCTGEILSSYLCKKKSPFAAASLNAIIPGMGYLYIGQKASAFTAFCLNGLFIGATAYFAKAGNIPAAVITGGFEAGWYFGGILGAKEGAIFYNERLFEKEAHWQMRDHKLFPILMLRHGF